MQRRQCLAGLAGAAATSALPWARAADKYPTKPIRLVVPFLAGGGNDAVARLLGDYLSPLLGQQVIVDNRAGAGGNIGTDFVAKSAPDGYTVLHVSNSVVMNPYLYKKLPFDVKRDFEPVALVATTPMLVLVNPTSGVKDLPDLIRQGRENRGKLSYASPGNGTPHHFAMELLKARSGASLTHVPYKGAPAALTDVVGGQVPVLVSTPQSVLDFIANGRLKPLAVMDARRLSTMPDVPAVSETLPGFDVNIWHGLVLPARTPGDIVQQLGQAIRQVEALPEFQKKLAAVGFTPQYEPGSAMSARIAKDLELWKDVAEKAGIVAE